MGTNGFLVNKLKSKWLEPETRPKAKHTLKFLRTNCSPSSLPALHPNRRSRGGCSYGLSYPYVGRPYVGCRCWLAAWRPCSSNATSSCEGWGSTASIASPTLPKRKKKKKDKLKKIKDSSQRGEEAKSCTARRILVRLHEEHLLY